jgi:hypothetical protein
VKLAEFNALCDREWAKKDRGGHGDVVLLTLTEASAEELGRDLLMNPQHFGHVLHLTTDDVASIRAGDAFRQAVNPITRTVVKIRTKKDGTRETARIRVPGGYRQTWWPAST